MEVIRNSAQKLYFKMSIIVSAVCVLGGLCYAIWTKNTDLITFLAGAGIGYLLKDVQTEPPA